MREFESWYLANHTGVVAAVSLWSGDRGLASEATDEAFSRAYERWHHVGDMDSPTGWTYRVAVNLLQRRARRAALERRLAVRPIPVPAPELQPEVWHALRSLTERQREAVALRYLLDLTEQGVADAMGVALGTASKTLATARDRLAGLLEGSETIEVSES